MRALYRSPRYEWHELSLRLPQLIVSAVIYLSIFFGIALLISTLFFVLLATKARAHDDMDWVAQKGLVNAKSEWCCGRGDCEVVENIIEVAGGWRLPEFNDEFVPYAEAIPASQNGKFVRCHDYTGARRCFISPPSGS